MEQLLAKHKKEQRDLIAQITALKKQALKKNRKAVMTQCADLQTALDTRQKQDIESFVASEDDTKSQIETSQSPSSELCQIVAGSDNHSLLNSGSQSRDEETTPAGTDLTQTNEPDNESTEITPEQLLASMNLSPAVPESPSKVDAPSQAQKPKKRNRAKERLAKRQAEVDAIRAEALSEAASTPDYRAMEAETMDKLLTSRNLTLHEIQPDGHCLFSSLSDQLRLRHDKTLSVSDLRSMAAKHIRDHKDEFIPYLFDEETMAIRDVDEYTAELETTAMWGSDMEILALAKEFDCPIEVLTAGGAPITFNADGEQDKLFVAFYKHSYGLGEHYNSCR